MSEELHKNHEHHAEHHERKDHGQVELEKLLYEKAQESRDNKHERAEHLDELRQESAKEALPTANLLEQHHRNDEPDEAPAGLVRSDLKDIKYKRTLQSVRKDLSAPDRVLSSLIHNPVVDALSAAAEKTVARPSGLLAGSLTAFVGSSIFLYIAKHYGYEYNFLLMTLLFIGGFFAGLIIELGLRLFKKQL